MKQSSNPFKEDTRWKKVGANMNQATDVMRNCARPQRGWDTHTTEEASHGESHNGRGEDQNAQDVSNIVGVQKKETSIHML